MKALTFLELIMVVVIIGILVVLAMPNFRRMRENGLDKDAKSTLKLIIAAQKIRHMETGRYFNATSHEAINGNLSLALPVPPLNWNFTTKTTADGCCARAERLYDDHRNWTYNLSLIEPDPTDVGCL
ncbi:MAG: hypothetical protein WC628_03225 [Candidatus Omnitrophota bacterium]